MARILVVDDEPGVCELLKEFLESKGFDVLIAYSGQAAIAKVKEERPHVMLLDIRMPGMDGLEVLKRVREFDQQMGIIMVTAVKEVELGRQALKLGADDYITKPIDLEYLETSVLVKLLMMTG